MRTDRELIDLVRAAAENGHISFLSAECERILELLELGHDAATIDADAIHRGTNVPQVQRGLRGPEHQRQWEMFLTEPDGTRARYVQDSPAAARAVAAAALRLRHGAQP